MLRKFAVTLLHLSMLALVCAIATYWAIRILTPSPASVPPPPPATVMREADPVLAARMFGLVQAAPVQMAMDIQALGAFAAGKDSAAVLAVDGKPARVYLLNQELPRSARLVEVRKEVVIIEQGGVRREVALPPPQLLGLGGTPPPPGFMREGSTLTAPSVAASGPAAATSRQSPARPLQQPAPVPQLPPPAPLQLQPPPVQPEQGEAPSTDPTPTTGRRATPGRPLAQ